MSVASDWHTRLVIAGALAAATPAGLAAQCPDGSPPPCAPRRAASPAPARTSVAVLYLENLSPDTLDAYLADGLTEEIISRLGEVPRLVVKGRSAVRRYRGAAIDNVAAVGRALQVLYILEGSVRRAGPRVRVSARLLKADDGFRVWGGDYDRTTGDLLELQAEIARQVATSIVGQLLPGERAALATRPTTDSEAFDRFLRGNYHMAQRTSRSVARAIEEYEAASRLDPAFVQALARIPYAYALFLSWGWDFPGLTRDSLIARGLALVAQALRQDPTSSDAWMAQAFLLSERHARTLDGVLDAFEQAIGLDPRNAEAHHQYGWVQWLLGRDSAAATSYRNALSLEPERPITAEHLARLFFAGRAYPEALRWADSAIAMDPGFAFAYVFRARMHRYLRNVAAALADAQTAAHLGAPEGAEATLALMELNAGDTALALARLDEVLRELGATGPLRKQQVVYAAGTLVALGEHERALALLSRVTDRGGAYWSHLRMPELDPLRDDPRFQAIVAECRPPDRSRGQGA